MASTNQSPFYQKAEARFLAAQTSREKLKYLDEMIRECPKHKSAEKMLAQLKTRRKKLLEKIEKGTKKGNKSKQGIKKEDMQAVIVGFTNTGKSSLLSTLTNAEPEIASYEFTTKTPVIGMTPFSGTKIQLIEIPAFESEYYDKGTVNTADVILILVEDLAQIEQIKKDLDNAPGKRIILFNKKGNEDIRKLEATLKSKKYNFVILNAKEPGEETLNRLKEKLFHSFGKIRIYTKEPGEEKSEKPIVLEPDSTVKDVAEKILHGFSKKVKTIFVTGPSSKFPKQKVGLQHKLKDLDIIEFKTW